MLVDPASWDLVSGVEPLLDRAADSEFADRLKPELMQCVLESGTVVCEDVPAADADLRHIRSYVAEHAREHGMRLAASGTHPFSLYENQKITARDRYRALVEMLQYVARRELVFGMHVHVAVPDAGGLPGGDGGRPDRAPGPARAVGQLAVLARRAHRPCVDAGDDLRRVPPQRPAAAVRELPGLRQRGRLHGGDRRDRRLHPPVVGRAPAPALRHARGARHGLPDAGRGHDRARRLRAVPREAPARPLPGGRAGALLPPDADGREQVACSPLRAGRAAHGPLGGQAREDAGPHARQAAAARAEADRHASSAAPRRWPGSRPSSRRAPGSERQEQVWNANRDVHEVACELATASEDVYRPAASSARRRSGRGSTARARCRRS